MCVVSDTAGSIMRKQIWMAALGYVASLLLLLSFLYWFLRNEGFDESTFLVGSGFVVLLGIGWGYIIASHILMPHKKTKEHLMHLTRDIIHELNLPLSTIEANTAMLARNNEDARARKRIKRIEDAAVRLKRLYEELVYTIKKEVHEIPRETFDLADLVRDRTEIFADQQRNPIRLDLQPCMVTVDRIGFEQVFDNLLGNAMKYSPKESPIDVRLTAQRLQIEDRGIGMDEAQLVRVYERYYQGEEGSQGEGIGLALVKSYCDREGIAITIDSQKESGTCVTLDVTKIVHTAFTNGG